MNNLAQASPKFQNGSSEDGTISVEREEFMSSREILRSHSRETAWDDKQGRDLGFWLLCGEVTRHERWERLRKIPMTSHEVLSVGGAHGQNLVKRCCDVVGVLFLLVVLFPVLLLVAVLIKLDSPGPVFFRHSRVGKDDRIFTLLKFRSMMTDAPKYAESPTSVADVRLTRVGRWIRRLSIDEMPQLINVLKGEMSLVGPRPEMPFIVDRYDRVAFRRLCVKPGITGLWQISPARAFPIHDNLQYDLHYIRNQSLFLDCAIIMRTLTAVIRGVGAI